MGNKKVIIIHPDRQHSLQTAKALQDAGYLHKYITAVYLKEHSLSSLFSSIAPSGIKRKFLKHKVEGLDDDKVILVCELRMLILSIISLFLPTSVTFFIRKKLLHTFNKKCAKICHKQDFDILFSFDTLSGDYYKTLKERGVKLVLDMSAPCYKAMYDSYLKDVNKHLEQSFVLKHFLQGPKAKMCLENCEKELRTYDYFVVASTYTKDTLLINGINEGQIIIVPYGVMQPKSLEKRPNGNFTCTYVGNVSQQKGCHYIFRIAKEYSNITFNLIGNFDNSYIEIPSNCILHGYLGFDNIGKILTSSDLFLFLSLSDGFGFAAAEAMAYGVPVVCSQNSGIRDVVKDCGWIIPPDDTDALRNILCWSLEHRNELTKKGKESQQSLTNLTWGNYRNTLISFFDTL